jgi:hypothetical protein
MPVRGNILYCPNPDCGLPQRQINDDSCKYCGADLGAPNVNEVSTDDEKNALQKRYDEAKKQLVDSGNEPGLTNFENHFTAEVRPVINLSLTALKAWLLGPDGAYKSYSRLLEDGDVQIKKPINDKWRILVDGILYGSNGKNMVFAALSLNNSGLITYGECTVVINEPAIVNRATAIEENSFNFVKKHGLDIKALKGYRAAWQDKMKLTVAKLHRKINNSSTQQDFCTLVLSTAGDRHTEEFIEVHIYKDLAPITVKSIHLPAPKSAKQRLYTKAIDEKYPGKVFIQNN